MLQSLRLGESKGELRNSRGYQSGVLTLKTRVLMSPCPTVGSASVERGLSPRTSAIPSLPRIA